MAPGSGGPPPGRPGRIFRNSKDWKAGCRSLPCASLARIGRQEVPQTRCSLESTVPRKCVTGIYKGGMSTYSLRATRARSRRRRAWGPPSRRTARPGSRGRKLLQALAGIKSTQETRALGRKRCLGLPPAGGGCCPEFFGDWVAAKLCQDSLQASCLHPRESRNFRANRPSSTRGAPAHGTHAGGMDGREKGWPPVRAEFPETPKTGRRSARACPVRVRPGSETMLRTSARRGWLLPGLVSRDVDIFL